jgi:hypothetical protein
MIGPLRPLHYVVEIGLGLSHGCTSYELADHHESQTYPHGQRSWHSWEECWNLEWHFHPLRLVFRIEPMSD